MDDFLSNENNKKSLIDMITMQKECHVVQAEGDAGVKIVKAAIAMPTTKSTT